MSLTNAEADQRTLTALFRTMLAGLNPHQSDATRFALILQKTRLLILDGWGASDAAFPQAVFDDHGPAVVLRALADAYDQPEPVLGALEGD